MIGLKSANLIQHSSAETGVFDFLMYLNLILSYRSLELISSTSLIETKLKFKVHGIFYKIIKKLKYKPTRRSKLIFWNYQNYYSSRIRALQ